MEENHRKDIVLGIKVKKQLGFQTIEKLKEQKIFDDSFEIMKEDDFLWLPVKKKIEGATGKEFQRKNPFPNLRQEFGIRAFDIIGDIIIIFLPEDLLARELEIGKYLLKNYPNIKAVYRKIGLREKTLRTQNLKLIVGKGTEAIHYENGLRFKLDISRVFFSPRQASERMEIINHVEKDENVCVFFSGIGPIPIYISSFSEAKKILGIELNEEAHNYALENIKLNKCSNIELIQGDIREIVPNHQMKEQFDLVIMPLPKLSDNYLIYAKQMLKPNGKLIFFKIGDIDTIEKIKIELEKENFSIIETRKGINLSPTEWRYMLIAKKRE
ncbi:MAG: methyltransferase domain-containing protein [Asgard group archaeon]|nr:methyltransferase domain-containing protein [Asgard group archaeon]